MAASAILTPPFLTAEAANFLFFTGLAGFVLLPLHLRQLGATDAQLGLIMGCYSATAMVVHPLVGAWVADRAWRGLRSRAGCDVHVLPDLRGRPRGQWVGLFAVAYSGAALILRASASGLADTVGRRAVIIPAMALQAGATVLLAGLSPIAQGMGLPAGPFLALAGLLAGAAHGFLYPALTALVVDVTPPERRGGVVGVFMAFILVGQAGGAAGFGYLAHAVGYGPMFAILSVLLAGACVLAVRLER